MIVAILLFFIGLLLGIVGYNYFNKIKASKINWEGLQIENNEDNTKKIEINTTEDLTNLLNNIQKDLYVLSAAIIAVGQKK